MSLAITSPYPLDSQSFTCTAAVRLAHTAVAVGVVHVLDSSLEVLLASESAAHLLHLPSCFARPVCDAGLGRICRCGSRRPCRA